MPLSYFYDNLITKEKKYFLDTKTNLFNQCVSAQIRGQ